MHTRRRFLRRLARFSAPAVTLGMVVTGCRRGQRSKHAVNLTPNPVGEAKALLDVYAGGQELGSEREIFDDLVARVTAADAAKGAKLKAFFAEIVAQGKVDAAAAKALAAEF